MILRWVSFPELLNGSCFSLVAVSVFCFVFVLRFWRYMVYSYVIFGFLGGVGLVQASCSNLPPALVLTVATYM